MVAASPPPHRRAVWFAGLVTALAVVLAYHLVFFTKYFPIQEGWFTAYAHWILEGRVPYRDFYLFLQPVYPLLVTAVTKVAGYGFVAVRVLGLAERLGLTAVLYVLLARAFRPLTAFVACVTAIVFFASNTTDVIDSYLQVCLIFTLLGVYCLLRSLNAATPRSGFWWAFAAGSSQALAFFTKQTTGVLVPVVVLVVAAVIVWTRRRRHAGRLAAGCAAGWAAPTIVILAWLALSGALGAYVAQVYGGAGSKGPLLSVLGGVLQRSVTLRDITSFALLCAGGAGWVLLARWSQAAQDQSERRRRMRVAFLAAGAAGLAVWWWMLYPRYRWPLAALVGAALVAEAVVIWLLRNRPAVAAAARRWLTGPVAIAVVGVAAVLVLWSPLVQGSWLWWRFATLHFFSLKELLVSWSLFAAVGLAVYWLIRSTKERRPAAAWTIALCAAAGAAVEYAHGMSYVIEPHAVIPALAVGLGALLEWRLVGRAARATVIAGLIVFILAMCADQRIMWPYEWWGWREPGIALATVEPREPLLSGFTLSQRTEEVYEKVDSALRNHVDDDNWLYCFPHIAMFYVTTGVYPKTRSLVAYWDVCPDDVAQEDATILLRDPPGAIVDLRLGELAWRFHEEAFRADRSSGQRAIRRAIDVLTASGRYELAVDEPTALGANLRVWVSRRADVE